MNRIVSLIASATEIIHELGLGEQMVGRSHECDYPLSVKNLPVCTEPKFRTDGTSYEIDQRVRAIVQEGLSVYRVNADMLENLKPTHIITQTQCEVCAVSERDLEDAACQLISSKPAIISLKPDTLQDIWKDINMVGAACHAIDRSTELIIRLQRRINAIANQAKTLDRKRVAFIEWIDPLMVAGNWIPELMELAGASDVFGQGRSRIITWSELLDAHPDLIIVSPCGFDIERTRSEMPLLAKHGEYGKLKAVQAGKVFVVDGNQYMNRPGPRIVESLEILAEIIHPNLFKFGHEARGWLRYTA